MPKASKNTNTRFMSLLDRQGFRKAPVRCKLNEELRTYREGDDEQIHWTIFRSVKTPEEIKALAKMKKNYGKALIDPKYKNVYSFIKLYE